ncbi:RAMP superfamily CRISPR-associated protein [Fusobacterium animalis]|uniref:RAMP superfamily CRISPR-associated protein n=1 Tax=Fusobacterium animalis TaxID=76859 RepID=UPI0030D04044
MDFSIFKNKYIIKGKLKVLTALHIGSGVEENGHDAPFITIEKKYYKDGDKIGNPKGEYFYIPGSSFRGYLSTKLERLLAKGNNYKFKGKKNGEFINLNEGDVKLIFGYTNLLKKEKINVDEKNKKEKFVEDEDVIRNVLKEFLDDETINRTLKDNSIENDKNEKMKNDKAFEEAKKYSSMSGRIHISDMKILSKFSKSIKRDGIKINRNTGATEKGGKFDYDILPPETEFEFIMELDNIENYQLELVKLTLNDILEGDLFGGKLSRGIGKCQLILEEVEYVNIENKEELEEYIFEKKMKIISSEKDNKKFKEFFEINDKNLKLEN